MFLISMIIYSTNISVTNLQANRSWLFKEYKSDFVRQCLAMSIEVGFVLHVYCVTSIQYGT